MGGGWRVPPKHFTLDYLKVHVQTHEESLPVCEKEEINSNPHLVINVWYNWRRQARHCREVTAVNNRELVGNVLSVNEGASQSEGCPIESLLGLQTDR